MLLLGSLAAAACSGNDNVGQQGVLARGTILGTGEPWAFSVWIDDDGLLCFGLNGDASCLEVPDGSEVLHASGATSDVAEADPTDGRTCASGAVSKEVERVRVQFFNGIDVDAQNIPGNGWAVDFYAVCIDSASDVQQLTLFGDQDEVLHRSG